MTSSAVTSLSFSPTSMFLATSHVGDVGIYLWSNTTLFSATVPSPLSDDFEPSTVDLPSTSLQPQGSTCSVHFSNTGKCKGNVDLCSMSSRTRSDMDHTVLPANNTISAFTRKDSPGGATTHICIANAWVQLTTHLSTPREWMAELAMLADIQRTVYPEEVTRQLHVMVSGRESSPAIDRRSDHCDTPLSWYKQFLQVQQIGFVTLGPLRRV